MVLKEGNEKSERMEISDLYTAGFGSFDMIRVS